MIKIQICSYVWKSIWEAKAILAKGLCWKVGMGTNISINDDAWILDAVNFRLSTATNSMRDFKVNELIDSNNRLWKRELINITFTEEDVARILRIPLARTPHEDFLIWGGSYQSTQVAPDVEKELKQWTIYSENALSPLVKVAFSTAHFGPYKEIEIEEYTRKKSVMEKKLQTSSVATLLSLLVSKKRKSVIITENKRWRHPHCEFIKINFDGAYNESQYRSASGIVAKDAKGKVFLSCSEIHNDITSAFAAEAIACWKVVQIGVEKEWQSIIFEGDSLAIVKKCNTKGQDRSLVGAYIYDIQQKISGSNNIRFQHTPRSANNLAHILVTETLRRKEEIYLEMEVPKYAEEQKRYDWVCEPD
ncbi:hypothetical protein Gotur_005883 [Gossypium turneri]